jgi:hypothetical protein
VHGPVWAVYRTEYGNGPHSPPTVRNRLVKAVLTENEASILMSRLVAATKHPLYIGPYTAFCARPENVAWA